MKSFKNTFRKIKKFPTWLFFIPYVIIKLVVFLLYRKEIIDPHNYIEDNGGVISVTWHNRLLFFPALFPRKACKKTIAIISASRDGQYLADFISFFGVKAIRGSSKRGGASALRESLAKLENGFNISITPDGPRGPIYTMSKGPIILASQLQAPIVPLTVNASRYWEVKSWDKFQIPKPFCKLTLILGDPIYIPSELSREDIAKYQEEVKNALMAIS